MKKSVKALSLILALIMSFSVFNVAVSAEDVPCEHTYGEWTVLVPAECEKEGKQIKACSKCLDVVEEVIPATGHTYGDEPTETVESTCKNYGYTGFKCLSCDYVEERYIKEALLHTYGEPTVVPATCTKSGSSTRVCSECFYPEVTFLDPIGHDLDETINVEPATCTEDGYKYQICKVCQCEEKVENSTIPALGHDYEDVVTPPTCAEKGYTTHTCKREGCGNVVVDTHVETAEHVYGEWKEIKPATCTEKGLQERFCTLCKEGTEGHRQEKEIPALGHKYESVVTEPTYTAGGYTTHICSVCGDSYIDNETEMLPDKIKEVMFISQDGTAEYSDGVWYVINYQKSYNITPVIYTERGHKISVDSEMISSVKYISSDEKIATIDQETGIVTGMGTGTLNAVPEDRWAVVDCVVTDANGDEYTARCYVQVDFTILDWVKLIIDIIRVALEVVVGGIFKGILGDAVTK